MEKGDASSNVEKFEESDENRAREREREQTDANWPKAIKYS